MYPTSYVAYPPQFSVNPRLSRWRESGRAAICAVMGANLVDNCSCVWTAPGYVGCSVCTALRCPGLHVLSALRAAEPPPATVAGIAACASAGGACRDAKVELHPQKLLRFLHAYRKSCKEPIPSLRHRAFRCPIHGPRAEAQGK